MDYFESAEDLQITLKRALHEVNLHQCDPDQFKAECWSKHSDGETIAAQDVLAWLGY